MFRRRRLCQTILFATLTILLTARTARAAQSESLTTVEDAPAAQTLELNDIHGEQFDLENFRGRVVLVNFWATWCPPCRAEMPSMQTLYDTFDRDHFDIVAVDMGSREEHIKQFLDSTTPTLRYHIVLDKTGETARDWGVRGIPVSFLIDADGRLVYQATGERDWSSPQIQTVIQALIDTIP